MKNKKYQTNIFVLRFIFTKISFHHIVIRPKKREKVKKKKGKKNDNEKISVNMFKI